MKDAIEEKKRENRELDEAIEEMMVEVAERQDISDLAGSFQ